MAVFKIAWDITKLNEGGYVDDPADPGGMTYRGISHVNFPHWTGWSQVEALRPHTGQVLLSLEPLVEQFYIDNFWAPIQGDNIINQDTANTLFDSSVNMGIHQAVVLSQRALGIAETGHMDSITLTALNTANPYA